jgi:uncharacterized membrane protein
MKTITTKLTKVEDGYAEIMNADTGRRIGRVVREKSGSGRTSVSWFAYGSRSRHVIGRGATRTEAVAIVRDAEQRHADAMASL